MPVRGRAQKAYFSSGQLDGLRKNESMRTNTLDTLCSILDCTLEEVTVYLPDEPDTEKSSG